MSSSMEVPLANGHAFLTFKYGDKFKIKNADDAAIFRTLYLSIKSFGVFYTKLQVYTTVQYKRELGFCIFEC
jgi:hypothetical protein